MHFGGRDRGPLWVIGALPIHGWCPRPISGCGIIRLGSARLSSARLVSSRLSSTQLDYSRRRGMAWRGRARLGLAHPGVVPLHPPLRFSPGPYRPLYVARYLERVQRVLRVPKLLAPQRDDGGPDRGVRSRASRNHPALRRKLSHGDRADGRCRPSAPAERRRQRDGRRRLDPAHSDHRQHSRRLHDDRREGGRDVARDVTGWLRPIRSTSFSTNKGHSYTITDAILTAIEESGLLIADLSTGNTHEHRRSSLAPPFGGSTTRAHVRAV